MKTHTYNMNELTFNLKATLIIIQLFVITSFSYGQKIDTVTYSQNWNDTRYLTYQEIKEKCLNLTYKNHIKYLFYNADEAYHKSYFDISVANILKDKNYNLFREMKDSMIVDDICNTNCSVLGYKCLMLKFEKVEIISEYFKERYNHLIAISKFDKEISLVEYQIFDSLKRAEGKELGMLELEYENKVTCLNKIYNLDSITATYGDDPADVEYKKIEATYFKQLMKLEKKKEEKLRDIPNAQKNKREEVYDIYRNKKYKLKEKLKSDLLVLILTSEIVDQSAYQKAERELEDKLFDEVLKFEDSKHELENKYDSIRYNIKPEQLARTRIIRKYGLDIALENINASYHYHITKFKCKIDTLRYQITKESIIYQNHLELLNLYSSTKDKSSIYEAYNAFYNIYFEEHELEKMAKLLLVQKKMQLISGKKTKSLRKAIKKESNIVNKINLILNWIEA